MKNLFFHCLPVRKAHRMEEIMRETILLFHFSDKDRRNKLTRALLPLGMKIREVAREDYLQPAGYLAGNKEILPVDETYTGEELAGEMILMAGLSNSRVDGVLKANPESAPYLIRRC